MKIDNNLKHLRVLVRNNYKEIIDYISLNYIPPLALNGAYDICMFCAEKNNLTKEHVLPKWIFENNPDKFFNTTTNHSYETYNKTTINACRNCNSNLLSSIEKYIKSLFENCINSQNYSLNTEEIILIIRWLEVIEYKFQVLDIRKRFIKKAWSDFIPYLKDIPLMMISNENSPANTLTNIRSSLKKISVKDKITYLNSLVVFRTKNTSFHFFHKTNEFIFLELPKYEIALFYFYKEQFENNSQSYSKAKDIISQNY